MKKILLLIIVCISYTINGQNNFKFYGNNTEQETVRFQLINNLIVLPIEINGSQLSFILDTGVNKTILFNLTKNDSIGLKDVKKVTLQGLGSGESVEALISKRNKFRIRNLMSTNEELYVILKDKFNVSARMGVTIHGIIGYNLLKDVVAKINYHSKKITFYNPKSFKYPKCRKCQSFPLQFYRNKPYLDAEVQLDTIGKAKTNVKMLIDSGGSDALWLFENTKDEIKTPKRYFNDILGEGLSGTIYGNRSRIPEFKLGRFKIKKPTVSFLDSISTFNARKYKDRNGSIGSNILKRFKLWIDYPNKKITFKKNGSFKGGFNYNMSGLSVVYNGQILVKEAESAKIEGFGDSNQSETNNTISLVTSYKYRFKPSYKIDRVVIDSPSYLAGLLPDDVIVAINGKKTHQYGLGDIMQIFQSKDNRRIRMLIERKGERMSFEFRLKKKI